MSLNMANSDFLRQNTNQHSIKNSISLKMDKDIDVAISLVISMLRKKYPDLTFRHKKRMFLTEIIKGLETENSEYSSLFSDVLPVSFITPDGGFVYAKDKNNKEKIVLVSEVKRQGTNDKRAIEGLKKQAMGNAIERLGKNLIGIRAIFKSYNVVPFVCFGQGYDFKEGSSILDRVVTMNEFFPLNRTYIQKAYKPFEPVSMYFRYEDWSLDEMVEILFDIATQAVNDIFDRT
jgi:type II restriction enzyme